MLYISLSDLIFEVWDGGGGGGWWASRALGLFYKHVGGKMTWEWGVRTGFWV